MITVVIAEDHQALIDGILSYTEFEEDIKITGYANDGKALLTMLKRQQPDIILCDIRMPKKDGITVTKIIAEKYPQTNVIAFTIFDQKEAVEQMLKAGARGYVLKNSPLSIVLEAIRTVASGKTYFDKKIHLPSAEKNNSKSVLSPREKDILILIGKGKTSYEIADELFISKHTVDTHRKNIIRKLGLNGAGELIRYATDTKYNFNSV